MIIIFEGLDNTGKTTLIKRLGAQLRANNNKCHVYTPEKHYMHSNLNLQEFINIVLGEYASLKKSLPMFRNETVIFDRLHISMEVYAKMNGDWNPRIACVVDDLNMMLLGIQAKVVYCYAEKPTLRMRGLEFKDSLTQVEYQTIQKYEEFISAYKHALQSCGLDIVFINTTTKSIDQCILDIREELHI